MQPALIGLGLARVRPSVLVVDDEESIRSLLFRVLERMGCTVQVAADADSALDVMKSSTTHVAVCDILMPGHDGLWLIERIARLYPMTPIIIATGVRELDPRITLQPAVVGYVMKPFVVEEVQKVVEHALAAIGLAPSPRPKT